MKEETGLIVEDLKYKGNMIVEYPDRIFDFDIFVCNQYEGNTQEFKENTSEWIEINKLLQSEKILSNIIILDRFYIKGLIDDAFNFKIHILVDEQENILGVDYKLIEIV